VGEWVGKGCGDGEEGAGWYGGTAEGDGMKGELLELREVSTRLCRPP